jgi:hypothetical protein
MSYEIPQRSHDVASELSRIVPGYLGDFDLKVEISRSGFEPFQNLSTRGELHMWSNLLP